MNRLALLLLLPLPALASHPPGATIEDAAFLDVTDEGFDAITGVIPALLPERIDIDPISDDASIYEYDISGMWVQIGVNNAQILPQDGFLDVNIDLSIQVSDPSSPFSVFYEILWVIGETCYGSVGPFDANIQTDVSLNVVDTDGDGRGELDATIGNLAFSYDIDGATDINLSDCSISYVEEVLNFFGLSIWDLALDLADPLLQSAVADFVPDLEATIEEAFSSATISEQIDLNGVAVQLDLYPADIEIETAGLRVAMDGSLGAPDADQCVAAYDPGGSLETPSEAPGIDDLPGGITPGYHAGLVFSDDFGNQALYSLWRGGLLCYAVTEEEVGLPIDTGMLGLLAGDSFDDLFPESKPLNIQTRPRSAPTLAFTGDHDVAVQVQDLGLEFYAELDHRQARVLGMDLQADVGVDLALDNAVGSMDVLVDIGGDAITATVGTNEFKPEANADIEANFASVFETLVGGIVGGLLEDISFALPSIEGFGLTGLELAGTGSSGDWLGAYASVGAVSYKSSGCSDDGSSEGCGGGCASGGPAGAKLSILAFALAAAALRRRK